MKILLLLHKVKRNAMMMMMIMIDFYLSELSTLKTAKGYALADILTELHRYIHKSN